MNSLIMTVLNESDLLPKWFKNISIQTKQPDEIVIVDGGSGDETWEYLLKMSEKMPNLKVFREPGNIAHGRNFAIRKSTGNLIVSTSAGCTYSPNWFKMITEPFADKNVAWATTGFGPWLEQGDSMLTQLIAAASIPQRNEFRRNWLPSSRSVAFLRDRWQTAGGYPEWVSNCEDELFDKKLIRKEGSPVFIREPLVFWRPRTSLAKFFKMLFGYSRGEGLASLSVQRHILRMVSYFLSVIFVIFSAWYSPLYLLIIAALTLGYFDRYWKRWMAITPGRAFVFSFFGMLILPMVVIFGDLAKILGFITGTIKRQFKLSEIEYY